MTLESALESGIENDTREWHQRETLERHISERTLGRANVIFTYSLGGHWVVGCYDFGICLENWWIQLVFSALWWSSYDNMMFIMSFAIYGSVSVSRKISVKICPRIILWKFVWLLFSDLMCRQYVVWRMSWIDAAIAKELCVPIGSLYKVVPHERIDVCLVDLDELVTVRPHWC